MIWGGYYQLSHQGYTVWLGHSPTYLIPIHIVWGDLGDQRGMRLQCMIRSANHQLPRHRPAIKYLPHIAWGDSGNQGGAYTMWLGQLPELPITSSYWWAVIKRRGRSCLKSRSGSSCLIRQGLKLDFTYNTSHLKRPPSLTALYCAELKLKVLSHRFLAVMGSIRHLTVWAQ